MTTKPEAIAQIEAALLFIDQINSHEHVQVLLQIDAYSAFKKVTEPTAMREVLAHIAAQDAKIAAEREKVRVLREAVEKLARLGNGDNYGNSIGNDIARAALAQTGTDK